MGPPSSRSSAFPCGMPSITSKRTTSPRPFKAQRWASVPPIIPAPMSAIFFRDMGLLKQKTGPGCKPGAFGSSALEPPARQPELDRVERLGADGLGAAVRARHDPAGVLEPVHLERAGDGVDDPEVLHPLA